MQEIDTGAMIQIKRNRHRLTWQQYTSLRGQVLHGDPEGALKGLRKILLLEGSNAVKKQ